MPRVNRDLQRRLAARRERERRRPSTERRYQFTSPEAAVERYEDSTHVDDATTFDEPIAASPPRAPVRASAGQATATPVRAAARGPRPYSDYGAEYAYVRSDLSRIAVVVGSILVAVIVLYFVLPH